MPKVILALKFSRKEGIKMAEIKVPLSVTIDGYELLDKICEAIKPIWEDERIPDEVKEEYKASLNHAIDSWTSSSKERR
jgi:hypothetical protein